MSPLPSSTSPHRATPITTFLIRTVTFGLWHPLVKKFCSSLRTSSWHWDMITYTCVSYTLWIRKDSVQPILQSHWYLCFGPWLSVVLKAGGFCWLHAWSLDLQSLYHLAFMLGQIVRVHWVVLLTGIYIAVVDPGFPFGGSRPHGVGGRRLPRQLSFENFVYWNERIWILRGDVRRACPLDPPMHCEINAHFILTQNHHLNCFVISCTARITLSMPPFISHIKSLFSADGNRYSANPPNPVLSDSNNMTIRFTTNWSGSRSGVLMSYIIGLFFSLSLFEILMQAAVPIGKTPSVWNNCPSFWPRKEGFLYWKFSGRNEAILHHFILLMYNKTSLSDKCRAHEYYQIRQLRLYHGKHTQMNLFNY